MNFGLSIPTKIHFGCGVLKEAVQKEEKLFSGVVLIVSTQDIDRLGFTDRVADAVNGLPQVERTVKYCNITANPKIDEVNEGIDFAIEKGVKVVIGVGGGSALDAAKTIAAGAGAGEHIDRYFFEGIQPDERTLPIVAIPTTAGTGSEMSKSGILSCPGEKMKTGVRGEKLYPSVAIVDPELTYTVPMRITMETGFDVLAHAVESYLSKASNYFTQILSEQAIAIVANALPLLAGDIQNHAAREKMSYASMIMGINLGNASTVLPHRMQYPIGALTDTSHGIGLAALYPAWIDLTYSSAEDRWNRIGTLLSGRECGDKHAVCTAFLNFMESTCGHPKLKDFGFSEKDASVLADMVTGNIGLDPAGSKEMVYEIYKKALGA